jgi:chaperonin GroEL (HSP60 family)
LYLIHAAGEVLQCAEPFLERNIHPQLIIGGYTKALEDILALIPKFSIEVDLNNRQQLLGIVARSVLFLCFLAYAYFLNSVQLERSLFLVGLN